jgi:zinc/manganese transport system substrate-binding protein
MNIVFSFTKWPVRSAAPLAVVALVLAGCAGTGPVGSGVSVVASTGVWGDVVRQVAGRLAGSTVRITSIISDPSADPHSYEVNTRNQLAVDRADVVLENGGGYDDFMTTLRRASGGHPAVLDAVRISGHRPVHGELNEHVWYDFASVEKVADRVAAVLGEKDPAAAGTFRANARRFTGRVRQLVAQERAIGRAHAGEAVAVTEPVPLYLLQACGLVNRTPARFSEAIEEGVDVPARVLQQTLDLVRDRRVALLAVNEQTAGPETERVKAAARSAGVPVVGVTETLPGGQDYVGWMTANLEAVRAALSDA